MLLNRFVLFSAISSYSSGLTVKQESPLKGAVMKEK